MIRLHSFVIFAETFICSFFFFSEVIFFSLSLSFEKRWTTKASLKIIISRRRHCDWKLFLSRCQLIETDRDDTIRPKTVWVVSLYYIYLRLDNKCWGIRGKMYPYTLCWGKRDKLNTICRSIKWKGMRVYGLSLIREKCKRKLRIKFINWFRIRVVHCQLVTSTVYTRVINLYNDGKIEFFNDIK